MMLVELAPVESAVLPVAELGAHLRLGTGFPDDGSEDAALERYLRAAIAAVEARSGKALIRRGFSLTLSGWREPDGQALPVAPVTEVTAVTIRDHAGAETVVDPARYALVKDSFRPRLAAIGPALPLVPEAGVVELRFSAGYDASWAGVPPELCQAVMLLAAHYYEQRADAAGVEGAMPFGVMALIEHFRTVRTIGGRR